VIRNIYLIFWFYVVVVVKSRGGWPTDAPE
jgi:hypothetical protein